MTRVQFPTLLHPSRPAQRRCRLLYPAAGHRPCVCASGFGWACSVTTEVVECSGENGPALGSGIYHQSMKRVFVLGAGFSRAINSHMPTLAELSREVEERLTAYYVPISTV